MPLVSLDLSTLSPRVVERFSRYCETRSISEVVEMWRSGAAPTLEPLLFGAPGDVAALLSFVDKSADGHFNVPWECARKSDLMSRFVDKGIPHLGGFIAEDAVSLERGTAGLGFSSSWVVVDDISRRERAVDDLADVPLAYRHATGGVAGARAVVERVIHGPRISLLGVRTATGPAVRIAAAHSARRGYHRFPMGLTGSAVLDASILDLADRTLELFEDYFGPFSLTVVRDGDNWLVEDLHPCPWWGDGPVEFLEAAAGAGLDAFWDGDAVAAPRAAAVRWFDPPTGRLDAIEGVDAARALPGVVCVTLAIQPGEDLRHMVTRAERDRVGYVVATGADAAKADFRARAAAASVRFVTRTVLDT